MSRRIRLVAGLACLLSLALIPGARAEEKAAELMAAYVFNFARFVEWPATQWSTPQAPFVLCATRAEALDGHLMRVHGRQAQNRRIVVQIVDDAAALADCNLLFIEAGEWPAHSGWLALLAGKPVLTVSDAPGFAARDGMISLFVEHGHIRFAVDRAAAQAAGLRMGARLLVLARPMPGGER